MPTRRTIDTAERQARLAVRHHLTTADRTDDVAAIADGVVALHSSDPVSVYLSATARMVSPSLATVEAAIYDDRTLVRHHAMRRTLWVATPAVTRLTHASSTRSLVEPETKRTAGFLEAAGVTDDGRAWLAAARRDVLAALTELGTASARAIGDAVPHVRMPLRFAEGKAYEGVQGAHTRVLLLLGFDGAAVRVRPTGSWINGQYRWTTMSSWLPDLAAGLAQTDTDAAAAELVERWLRAFGPATTADVAWWTGWARSKTRRALTTAGAVVVDLEGDEGWVAPGDEAPAAGVEPWVALLPALDPTTMGWKQRDWYLDPPLGPALFDRNGNGGPTIWADGRIVGGWLHRRDGTIATRVLADVGNEAMASIDTAAGDLERLLGDTRTTVRFPAPLQKDLLA